MHTALTMCLCSTAESNHVSEGEPLASGMVRGPVLHLSGGIFKAQHCSHFDGSGSDNACIVLAATSSPHHSGEHIDGPERWQVKRVLWQSTSSNLLRVTNANSVSPTTTRNPWNLPAHLPRASLSAPHNTTRAHTRTHQAP